MVIANCSLDKKTEFMFVLYLYERLSFHFDTSDFECVFYAKQEIKTIIFLRFPGLKAFSDALRRLNVNRQLIEQSDSV